MDAAEELIAALELPGTVTVVTALLPEAPTVLAEDDTTVDAAVVFPAIDD